MRFRPFFWYALRFFKAFHKHPFYLTVGAATIVESPLQIASGPLPPTVSGEKIEMIKMAKGPPIIIPALPVKNMIKAFGPRLVIPFKSILRVINTKAAGSKYLLAIKYKFEVSSEINPTLVMIPGKR